MNRLYKAIVLYIQLCNLSFHLQLLQRRQPSQDIQLLLIYRRQHRMGYKQMVPLNLYLEMG
jgi:hypothetical protein